MPKLPIIWTPQAKRDLQDIRRYIARDAPSTAKAFIGRIRDRVRMIGTMPGAGALVIEAGRSDVREIYVGNYRVIYRAGEANVHILTVMHGAQLLRSDRLDLADEG